MLSTTMIATPGAPNAQDHFELPPNMPEEDVVLLQNILVALQSLGVDSATAQPLCQMYKVDITVNGYLVRAAMPSSDLFEVTHDDFLFIKSISPARIESMAFGRSVHGGPCDLLIRVLDAKQRIMVTSTVTFFCGARKRKIQRIAPPPPSSAATASAGSLTKTNSAN
jgi:hypothetical protein